MHRAIGQTNTMSVSQMGEAHFSHEDVTHLTQ